MLPAQVRRAGQYDCARGVQREFGGITAFGCLQEALKGLLDGNKNVLQRLDSGI